MTANLFESEAGYFADIPETKTYLSRLNDLAKSVWDAAYVSDIKELWSKALSYNEDLWRLDFSYRHNTKEIIPFILLYLNRDDDA